MTRRGRLPPRFDLLARAGRELLIAGRFGLIGIAATALHVSVVWVLIVHAATPALLANLLAFSCAFGVSFIGNYLWTFGAPGRPRRALFRFLVIALSAFAANNAVLALVLSLGWVEQATVAIGAAAIVPVVSFLGSRFWGFKQDLPAPARSPGS